MITATSEDSVNKRDLTRRTGSGLTAAGMLVALLAITPTASATPDARTTRAQPTYLCQDIRYDYVTTNLQALDCQPQPPEMIGEPFIVQDSAQKFECQEGGRSGENDIKAYSCQ
ncbi:hypothetical protein [Streptomyces mirabilis]|uniref:hypothetical protein n=1 Tax=Streptomyces mirabilis TaxID=68239 RepID=UPI0037127152